MLADSFAEAIKRACVFAEDRWTVGNGWTLFADSPSILFVQTLFITKAFLVDKVPTW